MAFWPEAGVLGQSPCYRAGMMSELGEGSERYIFFTAVKRSSGRRAWFGEAKVLERVYKQRGAVGRQ